MFLLCTFEKETKIVGFLSKLFQCHNVSLVRTYKETKFVKKNTKKQQHYFGFR
jgi:hypothetical protein